MSKSKASIEQMIVILKGVSAGALIPAKEKAMRPDAKVCANAFNSLAKTDAEQRQVIQYYRGLLDESEAVIREAHSILNDLEADIPPVEWEEVTPKPH